MARGLGGWPRAKEPGSRGRRPAGSQTGGRTIGDAVEKREGTGDKGHGGDKRERRGKVKRKNNCEERSRKWKKARDERHRGDKRERREKKGAQDELRTRTQQMEDGKSTEDKKAGKKKNWQ